MSTIENHRRHPRVTVISADLQVSAQLFEVVSVVDLSLGGVGLEVKGDPPPVGMLVDIRLAWPDGDVTVRATIRHVRGVAEKVRRAVVGAEFDDPDLLRAIIVDFLKSKLYAG